MSENKTRKLICNITGKVLFAGRDYYSKKVNKAGTEEALHSTYMCREATNLIKKGYNVADIRESLKVPADFKSTITDEEARKLTCTTSLRLNNNETSNIIRTDPDVKEFIKNILKDDE